MRILFLRHEEEADRQYQEAMCDYDGDEDDDDDDDDGFSAWQCAVDGFEYFDPYSGAGDFYRGLQPVYANTGTGGNSSGSSGGGGGGKRSKKVVVGWEIRWGHE